MGSVHRRPAAAPLVLLAGAAGSHFIPTHLGIRLRISKVRAPTSVCCVRRHVIQATSWSPVDVADAEGKGQVDVILEADSYEIHWIEVDRVQDGSSHTVFSGLGYFLKVEKASSRMGGKASA
jgi:hypothetical protein